MSFKVGDKAVFIMKSPNQLVNDPKVDSIVSVSGFCDCSRAGCDFLFIKGYETALDGVKQTFSPTQLRKLDYEFVEETLSRIKEESLTETI